MTDNTELTIDRPISGDINVPTRHTVEQRSAAEFLAALDKLLGTGGVEAVRWRQYTPYFNDGEPCEFGIHEATVKLAAHFGIDEEDGDYEDGFLGSYSLYDYAVSGDWNSGRVYALNGHSTEAIDAALREFEGQLASFESVMLTNFGDHAVVTATREGFEVEEYEHD